MKEETAMATDTYNNLVSTRIAGINEQVRAVPQIIVGSDGR